MWRNTHVLRSSHGFSLTTHDVPFTISMTTLRLPPAMRAMEAWNSSLHWSPEPRNLGLERCTMRWLVGCASVINTNRKCPATRVTRIFFYFPLGRQFERKKKERFYGHPLSRRVLKIYTDPCYLINELLACGSQADYFCIICLLRFVERLILMFFLQS